MMVVRRVMLCASWTGSRAGVGRAEDEVPFGGFTPGIRNENIREDSMGPYVLEMSKGGMVNIAVKDAEV